VIAMTMSSASPMRPRRIKARDPKQGEDLTSTQADTFQPIR